MSYAGIRFRYADLIKDVSYIKRFAAPLLTGEAIQVLSKLERDLKSVQNRPPGNRYIIGIGELWPLETIVSQEYSRDRDEMVSGSLHFNWEIENTDWATQRQRHFDLVGIASTSVLLHHIDGNSRKIIGRWQMEVGDSESPGIHFHSAMNQYNLSEMFPSWLKVPRMPNCLFWPMDVLDFMLGELFQRQWLQHLKKTSADRMAWGSLQEKRIDGVLIWQRKILESWKGTPWMSLKKERPKRDMFI